MRALTLRRYLITLTLFILFVAACAGVAQFVGAERASPRAVWTALWSGGGTPDFSEAFIILSLRWPRIVLAFFVGAALAIVGAVFQALLRNPLAEPYTLGVAPGGSFGAVVAIFLPRLVPGLEFSWGPFTHVQMLAFLGSLSSVGLIYWLARSEQRLSTMELLLAGVTMGIIFSALILAIRYLASPDMLVLMDRWTMGGLDILGWRDVLTLLPLLLPSLAVLLAMARGLDQITFGEELASGRGVNVARLQKLTFLFGSMATAAVVTVAGPIAFLGLIVPRSVRRIVGPDHRLLLPCSVLGGGGFLIVCDTVARTVLAPTEVPVGILTALLGGPFFIYLLVYGRRTGRLWGGSS